MIGILCNEDVEKKYSEEFHSLFKKVGTPKDDEIIVFTISNIDFSTRTVKSSLISGEAITNVQVPLPSIIFNLSLQRDMKGIKGRRQLEEMDDITLINDSNRYDQWMIMDMLSASKKTQKYLLPYHIYNKAERSFEPDDNKAYIIMPSRGASLSRVIHAVPKPDSERITGTQYFKKGEICDYIDASMCQIRWLFIEVPELMVQYNHPVVIRHYMQKSADKVWKRIGQNVYPAEKVSVGRFSERLDSASSVIINHISNFLPSVGISFIDFILGTDGKLYFLHFSGFELSLFDEKQEDGFYKRFYRNLLSLSADYMGKHEGDK